MSRSHPDSRPFSASRLRNRSLFKGARLINFLDHAPAHIDAPGRPQGQTEVPGEVPEYPAKHLDRMLAKRVRRLVPRGATICWGFNSSTEFSVHRRNRLVEGPSRGRRVSSRTRHGWDPIRVLRICDSSSSTGEKETCPPSPATGTHVPSLAATRPATPSPVPTPHRALVPELVRWPVVDALEV